MKQHKKKQNKSWYTFFVRNKEQKWKGEYTTVRIQNNDRRKKNNMLLS